MYIAAVDEYPLARRMRSFWREEEDRSVTDFFNRCKAVFQRNLVSNDLLPRFRIVEGLDPFGVERCPAFADDDGIDANVILQKGGSPFPCQTEDCAFGSGVGTGLALTCKGRFGGNVENRDLAFNGVGQGCPDELLIMG